MTSQSTRKVLKTLGYSALYSSYLIAIVSAIVYVIFWRPLLDELIDKNKPPEGMKLPRYISAEVMWRLGSVHFGKKSSFTNFSLIKKPGYIRICAFGDSYVYGSEVAANHDYPSLLQREIRRDGITNVEVLNFGSGWHGIHQAYIMWDSVGRNFECDFVLLGPEGFWPRRETTFHHSGQNSPYYLHSRYIIEDKDVRRIDPLGNSYETRFQNYFRFIPHWIYARYDRSPPAVIQSLLPRNKTVGNPFYYYSGTIEEEALEILGVLFRKLANEEVQVVVGFRSRKVVEQGLQIRKNNLLSTQLGPIKTFPYVAPKGHYSALGNQLIAQLFYSLISTDRQNAAIIKLETEDIILEPESANEPVRPPVSSYDWVEVRANSSRVGYFVTASQDLSKRGQGSPSSMKDSNVVSLLAIKDSNQSLVDGCFAPLNFSLSPNDDVILRVRKSTGIKDYPLGKVGLVNNRVNIGFIELEGVECGDSGRLLLHGNNSMPLDELIDDLDSAEILVGGRTALDASVSDGRVEILPKRGLHKQLRSGARDFVNVQGLDTSGTFDIVLKQPNQPIERFPVVNWRKVEIKAPTASQEISRKLYRVAGNRAGLTMAR